MSPRCPRGAAATMFLGRPDHIAIPRLWVACVRFRFPCADAWSAKRGRGKAKISATGDFLLSKHRVAGVLGDCPSEIPPYSAPMSSSNKRVLVGMSGGVDSSVTAHLLNQQGFEVIGVTMKVWPQDCISRAEDKCCGPSAIADARGVAHKLGVPHYVVDEADQFERLVIDYFSSEYQAGRTPNPCVMCNELLKFGNLWSKAAALGADYIATGHYAIIEHLAGWRRPAQRPRCTQRSVVFPFQSEPKAAPSSAYAAGHHDQARNSRNCPRTWSQSGRQGGQPGDLLCSGKQLQRVSSLPSRRDRISPRWDLQFGRSISRRARWN